MIFPERFSNLPVATWPRLRALLDVPTDATDVINMTIGEPRHAFPPFVGDILAANLSSFGQYPNNNGTDDLLTAIGGYLNRRYDVTVATSEILVLNEHDEVSFLTVSILQSNPESVLAVGIATGTRIVSTRISLPINGMKVAPIAATPASPRVQISQSTIAGSGH